MSVKISALPAASAVAAGDLLPSTQTDVVTRKITFTQVMAGLKLVVGPNSSTDNGVPRFDGATGLLLQTSTMLIEDAGTVDISGIAAGTPNFRVTATSDVPTVTWGAAAGNEASAAPAGYLEIIVGGNPRYIPFWA